MSMILASLLLLVFGCPVFAGELTPNLGLTLMDYGERRWDQSYNASMELLDDSVCFKDESCEVTGNWGIVANNAYNAYNIRTYGAECDGSTDDITATLDAVAQASVNGGAVFIPPGEGECMVSASIVLPSNVSLIGVGPTSVLKAMANFGDNPVVRNSTSSPASDAERDVRISVRDLRIDANGTNNATASEFSHCMQFKSVVDLSIAGVVCADPKGDGIYIGSGSTHTVVPLRNTVRGNHITNQARQGISITEGTAITIVGNQIDSGSKHGIDIEPNNAAAVVENLTIAANTITGNGSGSNQAGISISVSAGGAIGRSITVLGNTIRNQTGEGIMFRGVQGLTIAGNVIHEPSNIGIRQISGLAGSSISITGNAILTAGSNGMSLLALERKVISGNTVDSATSNGIQYSGGSVGSTFTGNEVYDAGSRGILIETADGNAITGNRIEGCVSEGIRLDDTSTNNVVVGNWSESNAYGIREIAGVDSNTIVGNDVQNSSTAGIVRLGSSTIAHSNLGSSLGNYLGPAPDSETILAGATITADACGGLKQIRADTGVTTDTTNTFTAPGATNKSCVMIVCNTSAQTITLDSNANFVTREGTDIVLATGDCTLVASNGLVWHQGEGDYPDIATCADLDTSDCNNIVSYDSTPSLSLRDTDCEDAETSAQLYGNCSATGTGAEYCDAILRAKINGVLTDIILADADGLLTFLALATKLYVTDFSSLPSVDVGTIVYCNDCDVETDPCASVAGQDGTFAIRIDGGSPKWKCL